MNLDEQMNQLASGDMSALEGIYRETRRAVYYTALSVVKERMLAEDVMQSCYLAVARSANQYKAGTNARAWIVKIARNLALNLVKKRKRELFVDERETPSLFVSGGAEEYGFVIDCARRNLSDENFTILMLAAVEGYKRREIAQILEIPLPTVTWKYHRALKELRATLAKEANE